AWATDNGQGAMPCSRACKRNIHAHGLPESSLRHRRIVGVAEGGYRLMTTGKPRVLATRHFPPDVEARLAANFDAVLNPDDRLYDGSALAKAAAGCAGIMCAAGDPLTAETIAGLPEAVRIIATFSVGYEHVDVAAAG